MSCAAAGLLVLAVAIGLADPACAMAVGLFLVGMGNGLFLTPNNSEIIQGVRPARRGIANGIQSALQNTGLVMGTALALSIATSPLSRASQQAAYAGRLSMVSQGEVNAFTGGCRLAMEALLCPVRRGTRPVVAGALAARPAMADGGSRSGRPTPSGLLCLEPRNLRWTPYRSDCRSASGAGREVQSHAQHHDAHHAPRSTWPMPIEADPGARPANAWACCTA